MGGSALCVLPPNRQSTGLTHSTGEIGLYLDGYFLAYFLRLATMSVQTIKWVGDALRIIDQTWLPIEQVYLDCRNLETVAQAIEHLRVRGAPAIGIAAAYGVVVASMETDTDDLDVFRTQMTSAMDRLARTRPTAVNLFWALDRMGRVLEECQEKTVPEMRRLLLDEADRIFEEDRTICRCIGRNGAPLLKDGGIVLTHCNAGGLATADYGTALAVIYAACEQGKRIRVYADETRPLLQGSRLTAWELMQSGVDVTIICDNAAATLMKRRRVDGVIVGADRIAANGDVANKIGTYGLAILAKEHGIPFYVAAPISTLDMQRSSGEEIPIEERGAEEITEGFGRRTAPHDVRVFNPAFDVTPNTLVSAIISEKGVARAPYGEVLRAWAGG